MRRELSNANGNEVLSRCAVNTVRRQQALDKALLQPKSEQIQNNTYIAQSTTSVMLALRLLKFDGVRGATGAEINDKNNRHSTNRDSERNCDQTSSTCSRLFAVTAAMLVVSPTEEQVRHSFVS